MPQDGFIELNDLVLQDGFIHLTEDPSALETVFNTFYTAKEPWDWVCLVVDPAKLNSMVRVLPLLSACVRSLEVCGCLLQEHNRCTSIRNCASNRGCPDRSSRMSASNAGSV